MHSATSRNNLEAKGKVKQAGRYWYLLVASSPISRGNTEPPSDIQGVKEVPPHRLRLGRCRNRVPFWDLNWEKALSSGFWSLSRSNTKMKDLFQT